MMIGIQTVNNILPLAYSVLVLCCILGFAVYDLFERQVPNQALVFFVPIALIAPFLHTMELKIPSTFIGSCAISVVGSMVGFFILLTAALAAKDGMGVGGGDIKLATVIGFIYGPYPMILILLIASVLAVICAIIINRKKQNKSISFPFVPFLAAGSLAITAAIIFR